jgi:hypothetical protein
MASTKPWEWESPLPINYVCTDGKGWNVGRRNGTTRKESNRNETKRNQRNAKCMYCTVLYLLSIDRSMDTPMPYICHVI